MIRWWWKRDEAPKKPDGTIGALEFAHGRRDGDISGVLFLGLPMEGVWADRLAISDRFVHPLFSAILDRRATSGAVPVVVMDWNTDSGWLDASEPVALRRDDARALRHAVAELSLDDVRPHCAGCTPEQCLRCAAAIDTYISGKLEARSSLFVLRD